MYAQWVANFDEQVVVTVNGSDDRYLLDGLDTAKKLQTGLVYLFVDVPAGHPIALEVDGDAALLTYEGLNPQDIGGVDHYSGDVLVTVDGAFGRAKLVCANHANMGDGPGGPYRLWDDAPPTVTLTGDATVNITEGGTYTDAGAEANEDLTPTVISNVPDPTTAGQYSVVWTATDPVQLSADATRTVNVAPDTSGSLPSWP